MLGGRAARFIRARRRSKSVKAPKKPDNRVPAELRHTIDERMQLFLRKKFAQYADSGLLMNDRLLCVLREAGLNPLDVRCLDLVSEFDLDGDGVVSFTEFVHMYCRLRQEEEDVSNVVNFFETAFKFFDRDENSKIDFAEFRETMRELGDALSDEEVAGFMAALDKDEDGCIGLDEFKQFLTMDRESTHLMLELELEKEDLDVFHPGASDRDSLQFHAAADGLLARLSRKFSGLSSATAAAAVESDCCCCKWCCEPDVNHNRVQKVRGEEGQRGNAAPAEADAKYTVSSSAAYPGRSDGKPTVAPPALAKSMNRASRHAEPDDTSDEILNHISESLTHHPATCQPSPHEVQVQEDLPGLNKDHDGESRRSSSDDADVSGRAQTPSSSRTRTQEQLPQENGTRASSCSHLHLQQQQLQSQQHIPQISSPGEISIDGNLNSRFVSAADATPGNGEEVDSRNATKTTIAAESSFSPGSKNSGNLQDKQLMEAYLPEGTLGSPYSRASTPATLNK